jgi:hypothetical protein
MGYAISWLAVKDVDSERLLKNLELSPTGETARFGTAPFTGRAMPSGWFVLVMNQCEHKFVKPETLASLSHLADVIACSIEEHVMCSTAEFWRDGTQVWQTGHDAQQGMCHINATGSMPDKYAAIEEELSEMQKQSGGENSDTDYFFEIPLRTAKSIVGFKHDEAESEFGNFQIFKSGSASSFAHQEAKPRWKLW